MAISYIPQIQLETSVRTPRDEIIHLKNNHILTAIALAVHLIAQKVFSLYLVGYTLGCTIGSSLFSQIRTYSFIKPIIRGLYELHEFETLIHVVSVSVSLFCGMWSKTPAIILSLSVGLWKQCTDECTP